MIREFQRDATGGATTLDLCGFSLKTFSKATIKLVQATATYLISDALTHIPRHIRTDLLSTLMLYSAWAAHRRADITFVTQPDTTLYFQVIQ